MPEPSGILLVGLTGGIGCGRTTLAASLSRREGWLVQDADQVAHLLMGPGGAAAGAIGKAFGGEMLDGSGAVDRARLGRMVFSDPGARGRLEGILHPLILAAMDERAREFALESPAGIAVFDAALMIETGSYKRYHRLVVAHCPREMQIERAMARDGASREQIEARMKAQMPLEEKMALADYLIDTSGSLEQTDERAAEVAALLEEDARLLPDLPARRARPC